MRCWSERESAPLWWSPEASGICCTSATRCRRSPPEHTKLLLLLGLLFGAASLQGLTGTALLTSLALDSQCSP